ncbi:YbaK/EbsC family protein [bacterium]|nr:MAG: YbaK/EbsC family protein [bacterium]
MSAVTWVKERLRGATFEELHHRRAVTAQDLAHNEHVSGHRVAKVVVVFADGKPLVLVLPASHKVSLRRLKDVVGAKEIRMAEEGDLLRLYPDCELGAEPPLSPGEWVAVWMDEAMRVDGDIVFNAGTHTDAVRMPFEQWMRRVQPNVGSFSEESGAPRMPGWGG